MKRFLTSILMLGALLTPVGLLAQRAPQRILTLVQVLSETEEVQVRWPQAIAVASGERIAVADAYGPRLVIANRIGVSWRLDEEIVLPGVPVGVAWSEGHWVLTLRGARDLLTIDDATRSLGRAPLPAGVVPGVLAGAPGGGLLVFDTAGSRILRLDRDGKIVASASADHTVTGLAAAAGGGFLASIGARSRVLHFDAAGELQDSWSLPADGPVPTWPTGIAIGPEGRIMVADRHNGRILALDDQGSVVGLGGRRGWDPGLLRYPAGLAWTPTGGLLIADLGNGRVQLFRLTSGSPGS